MKLTYATKPGTGHTPSRQRPELWRPAECTIPWFTLADIGRLRADAVAIVEDTEERISPAGIANSAAVLHPAGTVLLSRTASVGFSAVMGTDMAVSQDFMTWTPGPRLRSKFLLYVLRGSRPHLRSLMYGSTHKTIYMPDLLALKCPLPPVEAQDRITDFIEEESARIATLIAELDAFDELSIAASSELVREAITGADQDDCVPVNGEWFTAIPPGWSATPLGHVARFDNGAAFRPEDWGEEGRPIVRIEHLNGAPLVHRTTRQVPARQVLEDGDLVFAWSGNRGTSFGPHRWEGETPAVLNQHIFKVTTDHNPRWLYWALRAATLFVEEQAHGIIGMVHITKSRLTKIRVPVPPPDEQVALGLRLHADRRHGERLRTELGDLRAQLLEYRAALIVEAVSGRLDVERLSDARMAESFAAVREGEPPEVFA